MAYRFVALILTILVLHSCTPTEDRSQWRGPARTGVYPETGLLDAWPEEGPEMLWSYEGLGEGHGSPAVAGDRVFVLGMPDTTGFIYSFDMEGNLLWKQEYGEEWHKNYTGPRSTPSIAGDLLYFVSGQGEVFCMETDDGEVVWSVDMYEDFDAQETYWGIAESPLVDGDRIIVTPGGLEHNVMALDRFSGEVVWSSKGNGDWHAYCSPILVEHNDTRLVVTLTSMSVLGLDAGTGELFWRMPYKQRNNINANSPVYHEGAVYCANARADTLQSGHIRIDLSEDGKSADLGWINDTLYNLMGGVILKDGYLYSSKFRQKEWYCLDAGSGEVQYVADTITGGAVIWADGHFYCYGTDGRLSLVAADEHGFEVISSFRITMGTKQHWAHPVIHGKRLYVRHGDALMVYLIGAN